MRRFQLKIMSVSNLAILNVYNRQIVTLALFKLNVLIVDFQFNIPCYQRLLGRNFFNQSFTPIILFVQLSLILVLLMI